MPSISNSIAKDQINAWRKALPHEINNSFHLVVNGRVERILAFEFPNEDLRSLVPGNASTSNDDASDAPQLVLFYGLGPSEQNDGRDTFKIFVNTVKDSKIIDSYHELKPLTSSLLKKYVKNHALQQTAGNAPAHLDVNAETVTSELIPPELEHFLSYAWKSCDTSKLLDQTEALYNGKRLRIERSVYDGQVYHLLGELYSKNDDEVHTLVFLGLHPVIPRDSRIYPFGPIFQSYVPSSASVNTEEDGTIHPVNFELSRPCPPCDDPPPE